MYGLYCLEAAVLAVAVHSGFTIKRTHWAKADAATEFHEKFDLPDVSELLGTLNACRKAIAYGDEDEDKFDELDPEDTATDIGEYVAAVARLLDGDTSSGS
jgi:hypothetical protein